LSVVVFIVWFSISYPFYRNPNAVALGRLGGLKGGKARAEKLSAKKRTEIAVKAAKARWEKNEPTGKLVKARNKK